MQVDLVVLHETERECFIICGFKLQDDSGYTLCAILVRNIVVERVVKISDGVAILVHSPHAEYT